MSLAEDEVDMTDQDNKQKSFIPPIGNTTVNWIKHDIEAKADRDWVEAKLEGLEQEIRSLRERGDDIKNIAVAAKKRATMPHECTQKDIIIRIDNIVEGWSRWWRGVLISFIGVVVLIGGGWLYQYYALSNDVAETKDLVSKLEVSVKGIELSQQELKRTVDSKLKSDEIRSQLQIDDIKSVFKQALSDVQKGVPNVSNSSRR